MRKGIKEYDENGNMIYSKNSNGNEEWYDYDDKGNEIHYKDSKGYEQWTEHDENGNVTHAKKILMDMNFGKNMMRIEM